MSEGDPALARPRLTWLDALKGVAMLWIVLNHLSERLFGYPHIANPHPNWPPLAERVSQLAPMAEHGLWDLLWNLVRYVGWAGDQGVQLFLIASGLGLGIGALRQGEAFRASDFYRRRLFRILPLWWIVHFVVFAAGFLFTTSELSPTSPDFALSLLGLRWTPSLFYYGPASWWYVGLLLQLYAVFPLLHGLQNRLGVRRFLVICFAVAFVARAAALVAPGAWMDAGLRGIFFFTRLPEFALGMSLAFYHMRSGDALDAWLSRPRTILLSLIAYIAATALSLTHVGMIFAPAVLGFGALVLVRRLVMLPGAPKRVLAWVGVHSYGIYLLHESWLFTWMPDHLRGGSGKVLITLAILLLATMVSAFLLERFTEFLQSSSRKRMLRAGVAAVAGALALALIFASDEWVRRVDPVEVLGWGERMSLQPDDDLGWRLKDSTTTRLRWETYDYTVESNALGFPGPMPTGDTATYRVMTVGDAFTSAEGLDTPLAWPRLLERELDTESVSVANFGMTGYGPDHYARVIERFYPAAQPDLVIIASFVNDFDDVRLSDEQFRDEIGFAQADPANVKQRIRVHQLRRWLATRFVAPLRARIASEADPRAWFLGYMDAFDRENPEFETEGYPAVKSRFERIAAFCEERSVELLVLLIPASVEVSDPRSLAYLPGGIDLESDRFDFERPRRLGQRLGEECGIEVVDLRPALRAIDQPYFANNLHWTARAHEVVAKDLAARLRQQYLRP